MTNDVYWKGRDAKQNSILVLKCSSVSAHCRYLALSRTGGWPGYFYIPIKTAENSALGQALFMDQRAATIFLIGLQD